MPELPEIETICRYLTKNIIDHKIEQVVIRNASLRWPVNLQLDQLLKNHVLNKISRRAKYLIIDCYDLVAKNTGYLIIHLGMSGKLSFIPSSTAIKKHDHVDFILTNNFVLRYNDPRRFGAIIWTIDNPLEHTLLKNLGPEPFDPKFNPKYFINKAKNKHIPIKQFIMDNKFVVGVGNIYANEALFHCKIHPASPTKNLTLPNIKSLIVTIKKILKQAIAKGGTTLKDFVDPNGKPGTFVKTLQVYGRTNQPCFYCNTYIQQTNLGQRSTFFCKQCQIFL